MIIREATPDDLEILVAHRIAMFHEMGYQDEALLDSMGAAFAPWAQQRMSSGEYRSWLVVDEEGGVAAGLGLWLMDWPPHVIGGGSSLRAYLLNVYTRPTDRRKGFAKQLTATALAWCREHGISTVALHASEQGSPLYTEIGFRPTNEMRLQL